jgi:hypothetical protein
MQWLVVYGGGYKDKYFPDIAAAKDFARDYEGAQIVENVTGYKFVRFLTKNGRIIRI